MPDPEPERSLAWQTVVAVLLVAAGFLLIAWSFIWPSVSSRATGWSQEEARSYQAASARLHSLSHQSAHATPSENEARVQAELAQARAEYHALRDQLDRALDRPRRVAWWLRIGGLGLIAAGATSLYFRGPVVPDR
jgi:hypothetical protein